MDTTESEYSQAEMDAMPYAQIKIDGEDRRSYHPESIWQLDVTEFLHAIDPHDYFITSGDAHNKARKLEAELFQAAGKARKLVNTIKKLRGDNVYMETSWFEGKLILKAKNPRKNREEKMKSLEDNFIYGDRTDDTSNAPNIPKETRSDPQPALEIVGD